MVWTASPRYVSGGTEPVWPTDIGAMVQDGSINWRAVSRRVEDEKCPRSKVVAIVASKVFAADKDIVRYSATANPLDWSTADDAGYLPTGLQQANANNMAVLQQYRANLVALNASSFQNWQVDPDPASMAILDQMDGIGSIWQKAAAPVANDLIYLSQQGVRSVGIANAAENLASGDIGAPIDVLVQQAMLYADRNGTPPLATYYPGAGQYLLAFPNYPPPVLGVYGRLPAAGCGDTINYPYVIAGGLPPYQVEIVDGQLPAGLSMDGSGLVTGEIANGGDAIWTVRATDALGDTAELTENRTGSDGFFKYLTTRLYPVDGGVDAIGLASDVVDATLRNIFHSYEIPTEALGLASAVESGTLRSLLQTLNTTESLALSSAVESGTLRDILRAYAIGPEGVQLSSAVEAGTLKQTLITTNMAPEAIGLSSSVVGGTLT